MTDIQNLSIDDLLPRAKIVDLLDNAKLKTLFVSGAGGSIGSEIARQLLENNPKGIILFDVSEYNLFNIERACLALKESKNFDTEIIPILGDIKDSSHLDYLFSKFSVDCIYHAAAYKHVPLVEDKKNNSSL